MNRGEYHNWDGHFKWWTIGPLTIEKRKWHGWFLQWQDGKRHCVWRQK